MKTPASILPSRPPLSPIDARPAPAPEPDYSDEPLAEGVQRRLRELAGDLRHPEEVLAWLTIGILTAGLVYSYWPGLMNARASWNNPQYSHGWLVPLCSLALAFWWRKPIQPPQTWERMAGLGLLAATFVFRLACAKYRIITLDMYSFVPALAGVLLVAGGWRTLRWAWAPILSLFFMYPLPDEATRYLLGPLQTLATIVSTFALQTLGIDAYREGNTIILGDHALGVVDACSGLRMLTIFVWFAVVLVLVGRGEWWSNIGILASAVPIALLVNSIRITVTGAMYTVSPELADKIFHDWAGYFMMPMALAFLFTVKWVLSLMVVQEDVAPVAVAPGRVGGFGPAVVSGGRNPQENRLHGTDRPTGGQRPRPSVD